MSEFLLAVYQSNLGQSLGTNLDNSDFKDNHSQPNRTFYMRETTVPNITTFCQSKAFGIKLICSYPLASALKDLKDMPILLANCVNKVVDTSKDSHDFNNEQFQISFDAADDIIRIDNPNYVRSIVASRNIKIFMKLEEPTETYNLFKELSSPDKISFEQLETTNNIDAFKNCTKEQANAVLANSNVKIFMKIEPENIIESQNIEKLYQQTLIQPTIFWFYRGETTMQMRL